MRGQKEVKSATARLGDLFEDVERMVVVGRVVVAKVDVVDFGVGKRAMKIDARSMFVDPGGTGPVVIVGVVPAHRPVVEPRRRGVRCVRVVVVDWAAASDGVVVHTGGTECAVVGEGAVVIVLAGTVRVAVAEVATSLVDVGVGVAASAVVAFVVHVVVEVIGTGIVVFEYIPCVTRLC